MSISKTVVFAVAASFLLLQCKKEIKDAPLEVFAKPAPPPPPPTLEPANANCQFVFSDAELENSGWIKAWEDEFAGDLSAWNIWTGGAYNNELQHYQAANLTTSDGILSIKAVKENVTGSTLPSDPTPKNFNYTSGRIESIAIVSASNATPRVRIAARIKMPAGTGMWPAFWTYGDPWPTQGEIDIVEARGNEPTVYQTAYWYGRRPGRNTTSGTEKEIQVVNGDITTCFHVYEVIWEKNQLTYYFDGNKVEVKSGGNIPNFFGKQQRVILNLAVGGLFFGSNFDPSTVQPGTMEIDWVKVFTSK